MDLLEKMSTFVRVVEAGSLSAAAKQLRISPAAVSRQIATLEAEVEAALLARTTRSMALTAAGREYYGRCVRILSDVEDAHTALRGNPMDGPLSISAPVTFGIGRVIPHLVAFRKRHPRIRVDLRLEDRLVDPVSENVDILLRVGGLPSEALVAHRITTFSRILVASPAYLRSRGEPKTPEALAKHCALAHTRGDGHQQLSLQKGGLTATAMMSVVFRSNSLLAVRDLAVAGDGVALLPDWFVEPEVARRSLRVVLPGWTGEPVSVYAMHRVELRGLPRVRAFIDYLREVLA